MATYEEVMTRKGNPVYECGCNLMCINPIQEPDPGVPINTASIQTLKDHYFSTPRAMYPKVAQVAVWGNPPKIAANGWMVLQSPEEVFHSLLIRIGEDITNNDEAALDGERGTSRESNWFLLFWEL